MRRDGAEVDGGAALRGEHEPLAAIRSEQEDVAVVTDDEESVSSDGHRLERRLPHTGERADPARRGALRDHRARGSGEAAGADPQRLGVARRAPRAGDATLRSDGHDAGGPAPEPRDRRAAHPPGRVARREPEPQPAGHERVRGPRERDARQELGRGVGLAELERHDVGAWLHGVALDPHELAVRTDVERRDEPVARDDDLRRGERASVARRRCGGRGGRRGRDRGSGARSRSSLGGRRLGHARGAGGSARHASRDERYAVREHALAGSASLPWRVPWHMHGQRP